MDIKPAEIIQQIYETIDQPNAWDDVLQQICHVSGSSHAFMAARSSVNEEPLGFFEQGFEDGHFNRYQEYFYQIDVWTKNLATQRFNEFHASHTLISDQDFLKTEIYNDFAVPADIRHSIGCLLAPPESEIITELAFMRGNSQDHYNPDTVDAVNTYLPHIQHSMSLAQKLHFQGAESKKLYTAFNELPEAIIICRATNQIEFYNLAAEGLFKTSSLFKLTLNNRLQLQENQDQERFTQLAEQCLSSLSGGKGGTQQLYLRDKNTPYRLTLKPWFQTKMSPWGEIKTPGIILAIHACATSRIVLSEELMSHYPLTQAEADICSKLCNGLSIEKICDSRKSSLGTVRQQIKTCLSKTQSISQLDMVNKLLRLVLIQ